MTYKEVKGDLFASDAEILVHCISADFALGAGIAKTFRDKYGVRNELFRRYPANNWNGHGYCLYTIGEKNVRDNARVVANLVTKERYWHKPTYDTLRSALVSLYNNLGTRKSIAMPVIGCGLDRLEWSKVTAMIKEVFSTADVDITVYRLN